MMYRYNPNSTEPEIVSIVESEEFERRVEKRYADCTDKYGNSTTTIGEVKSEILEQMMREGNT